MSAWNLCSFIEAQVLIILHRTFRIADDDGSSTLNLEEMTETVNNLGLDFSEEETQELFTAMDEDETGTINYEEFLSQLRVSNIALEQHNKVTTKFSNSRFYRQQQSLELFIRKCNAL